MSVKKAISLSFLLLANVIILVHPVVFHHHDHEHQTSADVCVVNQEHHCGECTENHCPDAENTGRCCVVKNCLLNSPFTQANTYKLTKPVFNNFDFIINNIPVCQTIQITDLTGLSFRQIPDIFLFYTDFVAQSIGLRAPPAC